MAIFEILGWASSLILVLTIGKQVHKQWHEGSSKGVSKWLFIGQMSASAGFAVYSISVRNWVFVVTNVLMLGNAIAGFCIVLRHRRRELSLQCENSGGGSYAHHASGTTR